MPSMDCRNCDGTGYEKDAAGEDIICSRCEGTGMLFVDEGAGDVGDQSWAGPV